MRTLLTHQAWIALAAGAVFFIGLGASRLWDDDEAKNATCAREMFTRGDWIVPTFNAKLRTDKPVLLYWLMLGSYSLFGATEFAARLPSALLAVGTSLLTYHLGRRLFRPEVGLWAGLVLATTLMFSIDGRAATPDSTLVFCTTAALTAFAWSFRRTRAEYWVQGTGYSVLTTNLSAWLLIDIALAMGVLAKGPVGAVVPLAAIGLFLLLMHTAPQSPQPTLEFGTLASHLKHAARQMIRRIGRCLAVLPQTAWSMRPLTLLAVLTVVALPWYVAVGLATGGQWPHEFFWKHNVERFVTPMEGHGGSIVFQFIALAIGFFPWTLTLVAGLPECVRHVRRKEPDARACLLLLVWAGVWFILFSLCRTKLPNYVLPAYPALAVAAGLWIANWIASPARFAAARWMQLGWGLLAIGSVAFTIAVAVELPRRMPEAPNFAWIGIVPLVGAAVGWTLQRVRWCPGFSLPGSRLKPGLQQRRAAFSVASLVVTAAAFSVLLFTAAIAPSSRLQTSQLTAQVVRRLGDQPVRVGQFVLRLPGLVFYDGPHVEEPITWDDVKDFFHGSDTAILVTNPQAWSFVGPLVPRDVVVLDRQREFPKRGDVLVVGRISNPKSEISNSKSEIPNSESLASRPISPASLR